MNTMVTALLQLRYALQGQLIPSSAACCLHITTPSAQGETLRADSMQNPACKADRHGPRTTMFLAQLDISSWQSSSWFLPAIQTPASVM